MPPKRSRAAPKEPKLEPEVCKELYLTYDEITNRENMLYEKMEQMRASAIIIYKKTLKNFCAKSPIIAEMSLLEYLQQEAKPKKIKIEKQDDTLLEITEIEIIEEEMEEMHVDNAIEEVIVKKEKVSNVPVKKEKVSNVPVKKEKGSDAPIKKEKDATVKKEKDADVSIKKEKDADVAVKKEKDTEAAIKKEKDADAAVKKEKEEPMEISLPPIIRPKKMAFRHPKPNEVLVSVNGTPVLVEPPRSLLRNMVNSRPNFEVGNIIITNNEEEENLPEVD